MGKKIDHESYVGKKFGSLIVTRIAYEMGSKHIRYECICECRKITFSTRQSLITGGTKGCARKSCIYAKVFFKKDKKPRSDIKKKGESSLNYMMWTYKRNARKKNRVFELTTEEFYNLTQKNCYYCDSPPVNKVRYHGRINSVALIANGLDRVDNNVGYTLNNSRTCCIACNKAKGTLSEDDFYKWLYKVAKKYKDINV